VLNEVEHGDKFAFLLLHASRTTHGRNRPTDWLRDIDQRKHGFTVVIVEVGTARKSDEKSGVGREET
jgi:hypothetical protein